MRIRRVKSMPLVFGLPNWQATRRGAGLRDQLHAQKFGKGSIKFTPGTVTKEQQRMHWLLRILEALGLA